MDKIGKVTGIGGVFIKAADCEGLKNWYQTQLGIPVDAYGWSFFWKDAEGKDCLTQWSLFEQRSTYFDPSDKPMMINYRVDNLAALLENLKEANITLVGEPQSYDYGKFAWILDPEGNKIELWEPIDSGF